MAHLGELLVAGAITFVGWMMKLFTKQHVESMKDMSNEMRAIALDVSAMKGDIRGLREHMERTDKRLDRLEDF
jgi:hypothetical protein